MLDKLVKFYNKFQADILAFTIIAVVIFAIYIMVIDTVKFVIGIAAIFVICVYIVLRNWIKDELKHGNS